MSLIARPVTRTDELIADRRLRSVTDQPRHGALQVACPDCGAEHAYRTGRRRETARTQAARASLRAAVASSTAAAARAARVGVPA